MSRRVLDRVALAASALVAAAAAAAPPVDQRRALHEALVEAYGGDAPLAAAMWTQLGESPVVRRALPALPAEFVSMAPPERDALLLAMLASPSNEERMLARQLRTLYLGALYARIGCGLAGVRAPPLFAPSAPPALPPAWLTLENGEVPSVRGDIDWLVIGSGPAGSVLGHELRRGGRRVVVIEQGPFLLPGAAETRLLPPLVDARPSTDGSVLFRTGRAAGGGTTVNIDLAFAPTLPAVARRLQAWGWDVEAFARADAWVRQRIGTRQVPESEINANNRILWEGATRRGLHPALYELNSFAPGLAPSPVSDKRCAVRGLLLEAMLDPENPLVVLPEARAQRIILEAGRARGVELVMESTWDAPGVWHDPHGLRAPPGTRLTLHARNVVLCAGAYGSPLLLMRSGVDLAGLGAGVVAHPSIPLIGEFDHEIDALSGTPASVYVDVSQQGYMLEAMAARPEYLAAMTVAEAGEVRRTVASFRRLGGFGVMLVDSSGPANRIDAEGRIYYALTEPDRARFASAVAEAARILFAAGARRVCVPTNELPPLASPSDADRIEAELRFVPNRTFVTSSHLQATCRMGQVVDQDHRVIGYENLYVVDASVFPESVGANPMQTIYAMAKVFADRQRSSE